MAEQAIQKPGPNTAALALIDARKDEIETIAPSTGRIGFDRLRLLFGQALMSNPKIAACSPASIVDSVTRCARWGLDPGKPNTVYFVPYSGTLTLQLGFAGMIELVMRDGQVSHFDADVVFEEDEFKVERGTSPRISHVPNLTIDRTRQATEVYAVAHLRGGGFKFIWMSRGEVEKIRSASMQSGGVPWTKHWNEMAKKTAIRRLCKTLVLSPEAAEMIGDDDAAAFPQYARVPDDRAASIEAAVADRALPESVPTVQVAPVERATIKGAGGVEADDLSEGLPF